MTRRKHLRRQRAQARFTILNAPLWFARSRGWRDDDAKSLGAILGAATDPDGYRRYVVRKHVELAALNHDRPQGANRG